MLSKVIKKQYVVAREYRCPALGWETQYLNIDDDVHGDFGPYPAWEYRIEEATRFENKEDAEDWFGDSQSWLKEVNIVCYVELAVQLDVMELLVAADYLEERGFRTGAEQLRIRAEQVK